MAKKKPAKKKVKPFRLPPPSHVRVSFLCSREHAVVLYKFAIELANTLQRFLETKE